MATVFPHRLRPLTSILKSDAQISGGETRQDYKDRAFPTVAPSCASRTFRFTGVIPAVMARLSHSTPDTPVPGRQFAPSWTVCTEPRSVRLPRLQSKLYSWFQSLKTQRIATGEQPTGNRFTERDCINAEFLSEAQNTATLEGQIWLLRSVKEPVTTVQERQLLRTFRKKTARQGGFSSLATWYDRQSSASRNRMRMKIVLTSLYQPIDFIH